MPTKHEPAEGPGPEDVLAFDAVLLLVQERTGIDFARYRRSTIERRVRNRMMSVGATSMADYFTLLRDSPLEARAFIARVTLKVSRFYRNPATFDLLRRRVIPELGAAGKPLRVWSAGCGNGEEAYTLAMLLDEADLPGTVWASDIDEGAIQATRAGVYGPEALVDLPADLAGRYLTPAAGAPPAARVVDRLRERVMVARHDLTSSLAAPGTPFHLVACRNVMIYVQPAVQAQVLRQLRLALLDEGVLCLGEAEWPTPAAGSLFATLNRPARLFRPATASWSPQ